MKRFLFKHRRIISLVSRTIVPAISTILPNAMIDTASTPVLIIASIVVCAVILVAIEGIERWAIRDLSILRRLQNACLKRKINIKNVSQHLIDSKEKEIPDNSEVHLLVNDI